MKLSEAARSAGCHIETIRHYERIGLIPIPPRNFTRYRIYSESDARRIAFIARCRELDLTYDDIKVLLHCDEDPTLSCDTIYALVQERLAVMKSRYEDLERIGRALEASVTTSREGKRQPGVLLERLRHFRPSSSARSAR